MKNPLDNPVYWLDSRVRVRERRLWVLAAFFLAVPVALSLAALSMSAGPDFSCNAFPSVGHTLACIAVFSHSTLLVLLAALGAAQRISQERERRTMPALANSPMPPSAVAAGKLFGAWRFVAWLASLTPPLLAAAGIWGGVSPWRLAACWLLNVAAAFAVASFAMGLSGLFGRSLSAYLATGAFLFLWCAVVPVFFVVVGAAVPAAGERFVMAATFYHLPVAPQIWLVSDGFGGEVSGPGIFATALVAWAAIAVAGWAMAVRGLSREVY